MSSTKTTPDEYRAALREDMANGHVRLPNLATITTDNLDALIEALEDLDYETEIVAHNLGNYLDRAMHEQEQREYATHPDERVRDAFGYGSQDPS